MDYEQKYKEALETVQEILSSGADAIRIKTLKLRLQSVFPELAESNEERIKKCIIDTLKNYHHLISTGGVTCSLGLESKVSAGRLRPTR